MVRVLLGDHVCVRFKEGFRVRLFIVVYGAEAEKLN